MTTSAPPKNDSAPLDAHPTRPWGAFLYRNPLNYLAEDVQFGTGDGTQDAFQLVSQVQVGPRTRTRNGYAIYIPEEDSNGDALESDVTIYVNGVSTSAYAIDHDRGRVVFDSPPADGAVLTWDGAFSHWVRFANDRLPFSIDNRSGDELVTNGMVELIEVNPPMEALSS